MFINKNKEAENLKKGSNDNLEKNIPLSGIFKLNTKSVSFDMLVISSDDTSVSRRFWNDKYLDYSIDKWCDWSKEEGIYIDVGAHTGLYTVAALISNNKNHLISLEPLSINFYRIITNLRLNNFSNRNATLFNVAVSDNDKSVKFDVSTPWSYLSKGGKINSEGTTIKAIKLDSLTFSNNERDIKGIKIDTEGEDLKVIYGAEKIIKKHMPNIMVECRKENILEIVSFLSNVGYMNIYDKFGNNSNNIKLTQFQHDEDVKDLFFEKN
jgi:FkbM family methyltransferase